MRINASTPRDAIRAGTCTLPWPAHSVQMVMDVPASVIQPQFLSDSIYPFKSLRFLQLSATTLVGTSHTRFLVRNILLLLLQAETKQC
jgi:hypothetical protein